MKRKIIIAGAIIAIILIGSGIYMFRDKLFKKQPVVSQVVQEEKVEMVTWDDPAGFSFQYPKEITINKHDEDTENYAHLELTASAHTGRLIIWAKDTTYGDIATWIKKDATLKDAAVIDTTIGGKPAKKIILTTPAKKLITGTIDDQILFTVEAEPAEGDLYWQKIYDSIVQSFTFTPSSGNDSTAGSSVEDTGPVVDEEEVLE
jgi:hypothetical protein